MIFLVVCVTTPFGGSKTQQLISVLGMYIFGIALMHNSKVELLKRVEVQNGMR